MKRRRAAREGLVRQRKDRRWEGRIFLGWKDGKRRLKYLYGRSQAEVVEKMNQLRHDADRNLLPSTGASPTVRNFLAEWLASLESTGLRARSWERYEGVVRLHLIPTLGSIRLEKLRPGHVEGLLAAKLRGGLAPRSVQQIRMVLGMALDRAVRHQLVPRNVAALAEGPKAPHREMKVYTPEQATTFLDACRGEPMEALYWLALSTGMRRGELLALKWEDVDLDGARLSVQRSLGRSTRRGIVVEAPKTAKGRRNIRLIAPTVVALRAHYKRQLEVRLKAGPDWRDGGFVFTTGIGTTIDPRGVGLDFRRILAKAGLPAIRFHDLRHSAATIALLLNVHPKVVSEMLGHGKVSVTLDLYSHVLPSMQDEAAKKIEEALTRR